jgi:carbon-monoxide dehydrogenase large subunit
VLEPSAVSIGEPGGRTGQQTPPGADRAVGSYIGKSIHGRTNRRLARGRAAYVDDIALSGTCYVAIVRSPHPNALVLGVDAAAAEAVPGVVRVITGEQIAARTNPLPEGWDTARVGAKRADWYALCPARVRYVGEAVAAVVAVDRGTAFGAAALVDVSYQVLDPVTSAEQAIGEGATLVEPSWGDNVLFAERFSEGDLAMARQGARTARGAVVSQRISGAPIEPRGILATYDHADELIRMWESTQQPHLVRSYVARALGIAERAVVVVQPQVGGAFGLKQPTSQEEVLLAYLAYELRRPVKWIEQRFESLAVGGHARQTSCSYEVMFGDDGRLRGLAVDIVADVGAPTAFLGWGMSVVTMFTLPTVYRVPAIDVTLRSVVTNKCPWTPCRGFGKDVATLLMERILDQIAADLDTDPVEVRLRNLIQPEEFPYRHVSGGVLDSGDYPRALRAVAEAIGYGSFAREQALARGSGQRIGLGIAMELTPEGVAIAGSLMNNGYDGATVRISPTGEVTVLSGVTSPGTGNETALAQIAADALSCRLDRVAVVQGDTDACPWGLGNYSSRSVIIGGSAVQVAAGQLMDKLRTVAASMLGVSRDVVTVSCEAFRSPSAPGQCVSFDDVVRRIYWHSGEAHADEAEPALEATRYFRIGNINHLPASGQRPGLYPTWASGAAACVVAVDPETGLTRVLRYCVVEDAGTIINPLLAAAQLHGGIAFGLGTALYEQLSYDDESGQFLTGSFMDYTIPTAVEMPSFDVRHQETPSPFTPHGTKGVGESGLGGTLAAVVSAIENAFPELDLRLTGLPLTPASVWRAIRDAAPRHARPLVGAAASAGQHAPDHGGR